MVVKVFTIYFTIKNFFNILKKGVFGCKMILGVNRDYFCERLEVRGFVM